MAKTEIETFLPEKRDLALNTAHHDVNLPLSSVRILKTRLTDMKYSQLRRGLSPEDAAAYVGSKELLRQFERAKWLKPFVRGNRLTRFDIRDLDGCIDRLKAAELLPNAREA
jgi:hypothetical protein